jgi:hypothetical protein
VTCCGTKAIAEERRQKRTAMDFMVTIYSNSTSEMREAESTQYVFSSGKFSGID